jgi:hypothetical protein
MASVFPRRAAPPALFAEFCTGWLGLSRTKMEQWWSALSASRWSRAQSLRHLVMTHEMLDTATQQVFKLYTERLTPRDLITTLEDLITEGRLSPVVARTIEASVLAQTDRAGQWKGAS